MGAGNGEALVKNLMPRHPSVTQSPHAVPEARTATHSEVVPATVVLIDPARLSYHILRPRATKSRTWLVEAYRCWSEVWKRTFYELENRRELPSDDFTRQDEILALFSDDECIALCFCRWLNLSNPIHADDSYFSIWPRSAREEVRAEGARICVPSNFTIAMPWRRAQGCSLKDVMLALSIEHFRDSTADALVGTMRNDRGMNAVAYRNGFRPIVRDVVHHGVPVDLVVFSRKSSVRNPTNEVDEAIIVAMRAAQARDGRLK